MYLRYGVLADTVTPGGGAKKNIIGTFDVIHVRQFPAAHRRLSLVLRIEGHVTEEGKHQLNVDFVDADYRVLGGVSGEFEVRREGRAVEDAPLASEVALEIENLPLPKEGNYEFAVKVDGRHIGSVPLYVRQRPADA